MILFWVLSAVLGVAALALALRPLLKLRSLEGRSAASRDSLNLAVHRDQLRELDADRAAGKLAQADYDQARQELEKRLLEDVVGTAPKVKMPGTPGSKGSGGRGGYRPAAIAGILLPVLAIGIYFAVGNPGAIGLADPHAGASVTPRQVEEMVERLAARLNENPEDVEGWKMLGKSLSVLGRFAEATNAYSKAAIRAPRDADLLADLADALAMARGQSMKGEPEELVLRALQIDAKNLKALALAGTAAYERGNFVSAARYWQRMLPLVPADSEDARTIQANIDEARSLSKSKPAAKDATAKDTTAKDATAKGVAAAGVTGTVRLSPKLAAKVSPTDTVFIFARAAEGPPMPLAVLRKQVRDLPVKFMLDDGMAMTPAMKLSGFPRVIVGARISRSGNAIPQPGDLQGLSAVVASSATGVAIVIDTELPAK
jgi:cytochrome c-type biogenesis protein CcmH